MLKTIMIITMLSSGDVSRVEFDTLEDCEKHRQEIIHQSNISAVCVYKKKTEMDYLVEDIARQLLVVLQSHLTIVLQKKMRE